MGLELSDADLSTLTARRGRILIERHRPGAYSRVIIPPPSYTDTRVSASAIIRRVGSGCPSWCVPGAQIIMSASAWGKKLHLGPRDETTWESVPPMWIQAVVRATPESDNDPPPAVERSPEHTFRDILPADREFDDEVKDEEGH